MQARGGELLEQPDRAVDGAQRLGGGAQELAHFLGAAAGKFREMRAGGFGSERAAIELVPVRMLENELADLRLDFRVRVHLRDDTRRIPLEQDTARIENDVLDRHAR